MELKRGRHSVYLLTVHLVFVTKRRGKVFEGRHLEFLKPVFESVLADFESELIESSTGSAIMYICWCPIRQNGRFLHS